MSKSEGMRNLGDRLPRRQMNTFVLKLLFISRSVRFHFSLFLILRLLVFHFLKLFLGGPLGHFLKINKVLIQNNH